MLTSFAYPAPLSFSRHCHPRSAPTLRERVPGPEVIRPEPSPFAYSAPRFSVSAVCAPLRACFLARDIFELAYNRIFAPGVVLGLTEEDEETGEGLRIGLQLTGKVLSDTVEIDLHKLKDEIVEIRHIPTGDPDDEENLVVIEAYDDDDIVKVEYDM